MIFYVWLGLSVQFVLLALVIVFVLAGASYQNSAIRALHERVANMQLLNLTVQNEYLDTQRALCGYQATGEGRFPGPGLLRDAHFFKLLTPQENLAYTARYQSAVGL